jgi:ubiquitin C
MEWPLDPILDLTPPQPEPRASWRERFRSDLKLRILFQNGQEISKTVRRDSTVQSLQVLLVRPSLIPPPAQWLIYNNTVLSANRTFAAQGVRHRSTIHLENAASAKLAPTIGFEITLKAFTGRAMPILLLGSCTVYSLTARARVEIPPAMQPRLVFDGKDLAGEQTMQQCGIRPGSIVYLLIRSVGGYVEDTSIGPAPLLVRTFKGKTLSVPWEGLASVHDLKVAIHRMEGHTPDSQRLMHAGVIVHSHDSLTAYGILPGSELRLLPPPRRMPGHQIFIATPAGRTITLALAGLSTIGDVQKAICREERILPSSQQLIHAAKVVGESDTLDQCGIRPGSRLRLVLKKPSDRNVYVRTLTGKVLSVPLEGLSTIYDLKVVIEEMEGLPLFSQRLFYASVRRVVEDDESIRDLGIRDGATLHIILALRQPANDAKEPEKPDPTAARVAR